MYVEKFNTVLIHAPDSLYYRMLNSKEKNKILHGIVCINS